MSVTVSELVKDDVILLKSGGQIPADGVIFGWRGGCK